MNQISCNKLNGSITSTRDYAMRLIPFNLMTNLIVIIFSRCVKEFEIKTRLDSLVVNA